MRIDLSANLAPNLASNLAPDQSFDVWHASLPPNAAADDKTELAFDLQLNDTLVEIVTPEFYLARKRRLCIACRQPVHL